ncbi:CcmD family protein [Roseivirga sp.]|uniref:CcmD family protein n=1 Tax=Roseivirga sp. TaxID=1964215 RepID=UPI002B27BDF3|nr:CcmD family protein [Roseivirga sp.]
MKKFLTILFLCFSLASVAQEITEGSYTDQTVEMADTMRSNGKIYVVVAVIMILFVGLSVYTISVDKKISKLEKEVFKEKVNS